MTNHIAEPKVVEKEVIPSLHFTRKEILHADRKELVQKLRRATTLGNLERTKVRIIFQDDEGVKEVQTTIWATGERRIVLKGGVTIPIHRILDVKLA